MSTRAARRKTLADFKGDREALRAHYATRAVNFFEKGLVHTKGRWAGEPFILTDWQREKIVEPIFGNVTDDGLRVTRSVYIEVARKNGKSEVAAGIALALLYLDNEAGAEIYGAACDRDQASIVFNVAADMVKRQPELASRSKIIDSRKRITVPKTGSFYRAIPADAAGAHGYNAHGIVVDELHAQPSRDLWDVLTTSTGAREQPLTFAITTAGHNRSSICWELHEYARQVDEGVIDDPTFLPLIWSVPEDADWQDERVWQMANPALEDFRDIDEMRTLARRAIHTPALEATFRQLYLSQWTQSAQIFIPDHKWMDSAGEVNVEKLRGRPCYGGLDLATVNDVAAFVLVFPPEGESDIYKVLPFFWVPEDTVKEKQRKDRSNYEAWIKGGFMHATPGNTIDFSFIRHHVNELAERYHIKEVAFDRWGAAQISQQLMDDGFTMVQFGQGYGSMSAPTKELLTLVLNKQLHHGGQPVLRWMNNNLIVRTDPAGNVKPDKEKATNKIDGMVATIMALDRAIKHKAASPLTVLSF
jgi:phage terminase large subunit-like protein